MRNDGITLVELAVVISIIAILIIAVGFTFQGWQGKYEVESTVKQIYFDLMNARARGMDRKLAYFVDFPNATSYRVIEDTNNNAINDGAPGDTILPTFPKNVSFALNWTSQAGTLITNLDIVFDQRGLLWYYDTTLPAPVTWAPLVGTISLTYPSTVSPDYDCVSLGPSIINMGKMTGTVCNAK